MYKIEAAASALEGSTLGPVTWDITPPNNPDPEINGDSSKMMPKLTGFRGRDSKHDSNQILKVPSLGVRIIDLGLRLSTTALRPINKVRLQVTSHTAVHCLQMSTRRNKTLQHGGL